MPTSAQYRALQQAQRARLARLIARTEATLHQDWQAIPQAVRALYQPVLDTYARDLAALRAEEGDTARLSLSWIATQRARLQAIEWTLRGQVDGFAHTAARAVTGAQSAAIPQGAADATALGHAALEPATQAGVSPDTIWNRPNPDALAQFLGYASDGKPLSNLFDGFGQEASAAARQALTLGLSMGQNPRSITSALMDALDVPRWRALTIARTEMLGAYRRAASATYQANSDVLGGWIWSADKSGRTCAMCLAMDGTRHSLDETLDSHCNCLCTQLPVTKSWADILGPLGIDASGIPETSIGAEGAYQSGADWFDQQDAATQRGILGSQGAYDAYTSGDLRLSDLVGVSHDPQWGTSRYQRSWRQVQQSRKRA